MKNKKILSAFTFFIALMVMQFTAAAQEVVEIDGDQVGSWFERNWMWVAGGGLLLLLIILFSGGSSRRRKSTTVIKDEYGNVKSVTTTEVKD